MNWKNISLSLCTLAVTLALVEGGLQVLHYPPAPSIGWRWDESPYRAPFNQQDRTTNQLGLRGNRIEYGKDDFVIVLVGDSQVEAGTQAPDKLPETLLSEALNKPLGSRKVKVFSVASAGWGQDQQLVWLKKYFEHHRADLVLTWLTPVNDYWENTFIDRSVAREAGRLKPTFQLSDNRLDTAIPVSIDWKLKNLFALGVGRTLKGDKYTLEQYYADQWQSRLPGPQRARSSKANCPTPEIDQKTLIGSYMQGSRAYTLITDEDVANGRSHFSPFLKHA
ncbi:MAG: hypothetical protein ACREX0_18415, partial [Noviherbaspirillum sp.]